MGAKAGDEGRGYPFARVDCTVTVAHSKTVKLKKYTRRADILVVAVGQKWLIKRDMVKRGAIVVDVGVNREGDKLYGDVDFDRVKSKTSFITPVPGGVGPMTITMLLSNVLK
jgi:methylenetetrahydrofolate dehydrogenase (NADP+)/methenyltetrahydrofolate cyclohydrolase